MRFDETRYVQEFVKKLRSNPSLSDDLLARYAITLPATDLEIADQIRTVRAYWNKAYHGTTFAAQVAKTCRAEDQRLRAEHGLRMETRAWWELRQAERQSAASVALLADELWQSYGRLGVVTVAALEDVSAQFSLTRTDAVQAVEQAGLTLVEGVPLPESPPIPNFQALLKNMSVCGARSVPELVNPGAGPFRLLDRYRCSSDPGKRLDAVAVEQQIIEADKHGVSATDDAYRAALRILRGACKDGVDLRDVALYHLVTVAREFVPLSMSMAAVQLQKVGLERQDAAVIAATVGRELIIAASSGGVAAGLIRGKMAQPSPIRQSALAPVVAAKGPRQEFIVRNAKLFISYSHRDDRYREQLITHLAGLRRQGIIADWHDRKIIPGQEWRDAIDQNLDASDCVLLLVTPDFLASDYCYSIEMQRTLEKHREGRVIVIPVIVRPADWHHTPLGGLEVLPKDAKPIVEWVRRDRAWLNVIEGIRRALAPSSFEE